MTESQKKMLDRLGLDESAVNPKEKITTEDIMDALNILADIVLAESEE